MFSPGDVTPCSTLKFWNKKFDYYHQSTQVLFVLRLNNQCVCVGSRIKYYYFWTKTSCDWLLVIVLNGVNVFTLSPNGDGMFSFVGRYGQTINVTSLQMRYKEPQIVSINDGRYWSAKNRLTMRLDLIWTVVVGVVVVWRRVVSLKSGEKFKPIWYCCICGE